MQVWLCSSNTTVSAKLKGALEGDAREKLWGDQREVLASMEQAEADSVDDTKTAPPQEYSFLIT